MGGDIAFDTAIKRLQKFVEIVNQLDFNIKAVQLTPDTCRLYQTVLGVSGNTEITISPSPDVSGVPIIEASDTFPEKP